MTVAKGILNDTTLCIGCEECVEACRLENKLGKDVPRRWKMRIDDLSSTRYTTIIRRKGDHFVRKHCMHCVDPACASVCIVGALQKTESGAVVYDSDKCMGCRYCMLACPYGIPRYEWETPVPLVRKCTMCQHRQQEGGIPACVEACKQKATIFGTREELLDEARRRIEANPARYLDKIVGETEVGGTSVLYISDISLDFLGWKTTLREKPSGELTWAALSKVPPLVLGVGSIMAGTWWITNRRAKVAEAEKSSSSRDAERHSGKSSTRSNDQGEES